MRWFCLIFCLTAMPAGANPIAEILCEPSAKMTHKLTRQYGSARAAWGMRGPEQVMEVWTDARGEWAMVVRYSNGKSCIVAFGEGWEALEPPEAS